MFLYNTKSQGDFGLYKNAYLKYVKPWYIALFSSFGFINSRKRVSVFSITFALWANISLWPLGQNFTHHKVNFTVSASSQFHYSDLSASAINQNFSTISLTPFIDFILTFVPAGITSPSSVLTFTYSSFGFTQSATFEGNVQGVVVQARR